MRYHGSYGHGLRPGTTADINCPNCQREDAAREVADDIRVMMRGGLTLEQATARLTRLAEGYGQVSAATVTEAARSVSALAGAPHIHRNPPEEELPE